VFATWAAFNIFRLALFCSFDPFSTFFVLVPLVRQGVVMGFGTKSKAATAPGGGGAAVRIDASVQPEQKQELDSEKENESHKANEQDNIVDAPAASAETHPPTSHLAITPELNKRIRRKLDLHLVPLTMALYLLAFLDRSNIGNARIAGMTQDLNLTGDDYDWLLTIFYIAYIVFEFLAIMWKIVPPHRWAAFCVFAWGLVSTVQAGIHTWRAEMALRFFMGMTEAGYGPGIPYLLSFFYLRHELGLRIGIFFAAAPLANTFAGALAYGITSGSPGLAKWRVLFLVEGLPTIVMAVVTWFFLPDSPDTARFLNDEEKRGARARGIRQAGNAERVGGVDVKELVRGLLDVKAWILGVSTSQLNCSLPMLIILAAYVFLLQRRFLLSPRFPAHHPARHGLYSRYSPGADSAPLLPFLLGHHHHALYSRPHPAAGPHDRAPQPRWRRRLPGARDGQKRCSALHSRLPRERRHLSRNCEHPTLGTEQPGQR
jgi:hypothetical protein